MVISAVAEGSRTASERVNVKVELPFVLKSRTRIIHTLGGGLMTCSLLKRGDEDSGLNY